MTRLEGTVLDAWGRVRANGIEIDEQGTIVRLLGERPQGAGGAGTRTPRAGAADGRDPGAGRPEGGADESRDGAASTARGEGGCWIVPGLIDIHCHGGGGGSFPDAAGDPAAIEAAIFAHRRAGTTAMLASLVSMIDPVPAIEALVPWCEAGDLLGIHMEGPYISPHKCGAQNPQAVRPPDLAELGSWLEAGDGWIKSMTLAPEVPGALEAARLLWRHGAIPSWGHTSGDTRAARDVLEACAREGIRQSATHLFNAMPSIGHRNPGPVRELLASARRGECVVELVADGVHLDLDLVGDVVNFVEASKTAGEGGSVAFVTDAIAGAGMPDGEYVLGGLAVTITGSVARLTGTETIAGGSARLAEELARTVGASAVSLPQAVRACVAGPASAIGLTGAEPGVCLDFAPGRTVSCVVLGPDCEVREVWREGERVS